MNRDRRGQIARVAIVEDHLLQRLRTTELLESQADLQVVHVCDTQAEFLQWLRVAPPHQRPHLLILDLVADRQANADPRVTSALVRAGLRILVLSAMTSPALVRSMLRAGVTAVVGKRDTEDDVLAAVRDALRGQQWLTPELAGIIAGDSERPPLSIQEEQTLILYASGLTLQEVADSIGVKPATAKQYLKRVKAKYAAVGRPAHTKLDLSRIADADGYLT
ncbi:response regulator transcription factor [Cumulibacter soli]|uniref:response regulator transcription factor n=1 Tax=Cumulibacter soli TaxID=2546344 RepID=UPI0010678DBD|nr:response regulator transcription factor [Cumulibacter soli]